MGQYLHTTLPRKGGPKFNPGWMLEEGEKAENGRDRGPDNSGKRQKERERNTYTKERILLRC
jgi:hypothetical protein